MKTFYKIIDNEAQVIIGNKIDNSWIEYEIGNEPQELIDALEVGKVVNELSAKIAEAKAYLTSTDYKVLPDYDKPDAEIVAKRQEAREFIRANEESK